MTRTGGDKTKKKILEVAESLFAKNGFHATSINRITREANVNKALVYYYFKDKNDIVVSLFQGIMDDLSDLESSRQRAAGLENSEPGSAEALKQEVSFLKEKKKIISVMLMESLKSEDRDISLFRCSELVMAHEHEGQHTLSEVIHEFFTGFIPLITYVALEDKFCEYFHCTQEEALDHFVASFTRSHINNHIA